MMKFCEAPSS